MRSIRCVVLSLALMGAATAVPPAATDEEFIRNVDWEQVGRLPVMSSDIPVSMRTFSMDRIASVTGRKRFENAPPEFSALEMIFQPDVWIDRAQMEVGDRAARQLPGGKRAAITGAAESFAIVPTRTLRGEPGEWLSAPRIKASGEAARYVAILSACEAMGQAFLGRNATAFIQAFDALSSALRALPEWADVPIGRVALDWQTARWNPFGRAVWVYAAGAALFGWLLFGGRRRPRGLWPTALLLLAAGIVIQAAGIAARGMIVQRMPLSNLYESLVFAVAGLALVALIFEALTRRSYCGFGGAALGAVFAAMGNALPVDMTRASHAVPALQSYWLHIHVSVIMLSYSAFALSFFLSLAYLVRWLRVGSRPAAALAGGGAGPNAGGAALAGEDETLPFLERLIFRVILVGFPLLTLGIVTGAIWANTAWQRPWGWDPKEVWAAITWIIYAAYIHARLIFRHRPVLFVVLALLGFVAVLFTYLGVSFLLPGLHSYA